MAINMSETLKSAGFYIAGDYDIDNMIGRLSLKEIVCSTSKIPTSRKKMEYLIDPKLVKSQSIGSYTAISNKDNNCVELGLVGDKKVIRIYTQNLSLGESFNRMITIDNTDGIYISTLLATGLSNSVLVYSTASLTYEADNDCVREHFSSRTQIYSPNVLQALKSICGDDVICQEEAISGAILGNINPVLHNSVYIRRKTFLTGKQVFTKPPLLDESDISARKKFEFPATKPLIMIGEKASENSTRRMIKSLE